MISREPPQENNTQDDQAVLSRFLDRFTPMIFVDAILQAENDEARLRLAGKLGAKFDRFEAVRRLLGYVAHLRAGHEKSVEELELLERYARIVLQVFLERRTRQVRRGLCISVETDDGEVLSTFGFALNEGVTEWMTRQLNSATVNYDIAGDGDEHNASSAYVFEVALVGRLVDVFGEKPILRAYFSDDDDFDRLVQTIDERFGRGAYRTIGTLSDKGQWRQVFAYIADRISASRETGDP